ncbi:MAG: glycosyltransferase family 39 protein [Candidatus Korobacteraceae bacterium]
MKGTLVKIIRSPVYMMLVAFLVRVVYTLISRSYYFVGLWDMFEPANLARSLAIGHGYSDPYVAATGPSALIPPIYPWIASLAFRAFGVFSHGAGFAMVVFNSVFSALTCWTVYRIARRVFNETVAVWSGWLWAASPFAIYYSVGWIWESTLSAFLLSLLFLLTLEMEGDARLTSWVVYALLWGIAGLTNTAELSWLPFSGCWLAYQLHRRGKRFLVPVLLSAAVFWVTLSPWLVRNYLAFGQMVFIRDNFGNEFRSGNNPLSQGVKVANYDMAANGNIFALYERMGEIAINKKQADEGKAWVSQHPQRFLELCLLRFYYFWGGIPRKYDTDPFASLKHLKNLLFLASSLLAIAGLVLAIKKRVHGTFLFATLLLFYPLAYYISVTEPRYRHAIEPQLLILSMYLFWALAMRFLPHRQPVQDEVMATTH